MKEDLEKIVDEFEELKKKLDGWCKYYEGERPEKENLGDTHDKLMSGTKMVAESWHTDLLLLRVSVVLASLEDMVTKM